MVCSDLSENLTARISGVIVSFFRYHVGKLALFLVPAEKLHILPSFAGGNDALPPKHREFMQSHNALSFTPTSRAKAPSCAQEMREIMWVKFTQPMLPKDQDCRDLVQHVFTCDAFQTWLHAALSMHAPQTSSSSRQPRLELGRSNIGSAAPPSRSDHQFQGPPSHFPSQYRPSHDPNQLHGRESRDPRVQPFSDFRDRDRSYQGHHHPPPAQYAPPYPPPHPSYQYQDHRDYAGHSNWDNARGSHDDQEQTRVAHARRGFSGASAPEHGRESRDPRVQPFSDFRDRDRSYQGHHHPPPAQFDGDHELRRVRSRDENGSGRRSGWDDRR